MKASSCQHCGGALRQGVDECPECGRPVYAADVKHRPSGDEIERKRRDDETLFTADHERKRFELMPRQEGETVQAFAARINRQKTPAILAEHKRLREALPKTSMNNLNLPRLPELPVAEREPGADDDQEAHSEQAA